jgi:hypothetical protein
MAVLWLVAPCTLYCLHRTGGDEGCADRWNVRKLIRVYTAVQRKRQPSSYTPLWEPQFTLATLAVYWMVKYLKELICSSAKRCWQNFCFLLFTLCLQRALFSISDIRIFHILTPLHCTYYLVVGLSTRWSRICQTQVYSFVISVSNCIYISCLLKFLRIFIDVIVSVFLAEEQGRKFLSFISANKYFLI